MTAGRPCREPERTLGTARELVRHVLACDPCDASLAASPGQGLRALLAGPEERHGDTAVERILSAAAEAGRGRLADLAYELAKACLVVDAEFEVRVHAAVPPRDFEQVRDESSIARARLSGASRTARVGEERRRAAAAVAGSLPEARPEVSRALRTGETCLAVLEGVEGDTPRLRLARSAIHNQSGRYAESERALRELLRRRLTLGEVVFARQGLARSLLRQRRFEEAEAECARGLEQAPGDFFLHLTALVARVHAEGEHGLASAAERFRTAAAGLDEERRAALVARTASDLAGHLGRPVREVERLLGLEGGS